MADIKFMDISENDNPANTDSVLIANEENGVKRTSLANLGKALGTTNLLKIQRVSANLSTSTNNIYPLTAPEIPGYTFLFWLAPQITHINGLAHTDHPENSSANFYVTVTDSKTDPQAEVAAYPLYIKNTIA